MNENTEQTQVDDICSMDNQTLQNEDRYPMLHLGLLNQEEKLTFKVLFSIILECADLAVAQLEKRPELKRLEELFGSILITANPEISVALEQCGIDI